jgi:hypothetical protein
MLKKSYCTQNNGNCAMCALSNYGRDCANNPIEIKTRSERLSGIDYIRAKVKTPADNHPRTRAAIVRQIPDCGLSLRQAEAVAAALHKAWAGGKAKAVAEILDEGAVWDSRAQKLREIAA